MIRIPNSPKQYLLGWFLECLLPSHPRHLSATTYRDLDSFQELQQRLLLSLSHSGSWNLSIQTKSFTNRDACQFSASPTIRWTFIVQQWSTKWYLQLISYSYFTYRKPRYIESPNWMFIRSTPTTSLQITSTSPPTPPLFLLNSRIIIIIIENTKRVHTLIHLDITEDFSPFSKYRVHLSHIHPLLIHMPNTSYT